MADPRIIIASDHGGLELKQGLAAALKGWSWSVEDLGCHDSASVDYPDLALDLARRVAAGLAPLGLLVCGTGIGVSIAANKVPGVRAALCSEPYSAALARRHNDANVLCLGGRVLGPELAMAVLEAFLGADFEGGRHQRRLDKIAAAEQGE
jgi:ribose 5-phosphate isomerase B